MENEAIQTITLAITKHNNKLYQLYYNNAMA